MRLLVDSLIAVMLVTLLGSVVSAQRRGQQQEQTCTAVQDALARLHQQVVYHGALGDSTLSDNGFPQQVRPDWFGDRFPCNNLSNNLHRPWIDVAPPGDLSDQPPDPVLDDPHQAGFWYNPNRGLFRARVPAQISDEQTLALYNQVNNCQMNRLPLAVDEERQPIAHAPVPAAAVARGPSAGEASVAAEVSPQAPPPAHPSLRDMD